MVIQMKILVLSDSHGVMEYMQWAVEREKPDEIIHLGDHIDDAERLAEQYWSIPVLRVPGNCDRRYDVPEKAVRDIGGVRIFFTHGHRYQVKLTQQRLEYAAMEAGAQVALFGHTHIAKCSQYNGIWLMNPGACGAFGRKTYGIITIENSVAECRIQSIDMEDGK